MTDIKNIQVRGDRVLVKMLEDVDKVGSFYVPESVLERKKKRRKDVWKAEVINCGDRLDYEYLKHRLAPGDIIYCAPVSLDCPKFTIGETTYVIITQDDLCAIEVKETTETK